MALFFLVRSGKSTATLSIMVISAVAALIFLSALSVGVNDAMLRNTIGLFSGHIAGYDISATLHPKDLMVNGVNGVLKRVYLPGMLSSGGLAQSLLLCGIDPSREAALTALPKTVIEGRYPQNGHAQVLISRPLAGQLGVKIGDSLLFISQIHDIHLRLTVAGIYQTRIDRLDRGVAFCPQDMIPPKTLPWSAAVFLQPEANPRKIIAQYRQKWPRQYRFDSWETLMPDLKQLIDLEYLSMSIVIFLVFGVVSVGIAGSFVIFIIKNLREYGIMKAMGVTTGEMTMLIVMKVALMNTLACGLGVLIGCLAVWGVTTFGGIDITAFTSHNQYFSVSGVLYPRLTIFSLLAPPATALIFGLLAAVWPAVLLARKKAADIMRMI